MTGNSRFAVSVHILAYLAFRHGAAVPSAEIARSVSTHAVVIRRLLSQLVKAGFVVAHKGAAGGFALARPARQITLCDVYRAVEPHPQRGLDRFAPNHRCPVGARIADVLQQIFGDAQRQMERTLGEATIADVQRQVETGHARVG